MIFYKRTSEIKSFSVLAAMNKDGMIWRSLEKKNIIKIKSKEEFPVKIYDIKYQNGELDIDLGNFYGHVYVKNIQDDIVIYNSKYNVIKERLFLCKEAKVINWLYRNFKWFRKLLFTKTGFGHFFGFLINHHVMSFIEKV